MISREALQYTEDLIAKLLIEIGSLKTKRFEISLMAAHSEGFFFCCTYQLFAIAHSTQIISDPEEFYLKPTPECPS